MSGEETILTRRQRLSLVPRACEGCKIRKIRCDRSHPCSNCRAAGIACQQAHAVQESRPTSKPDRVSQLEDYVATLEARLSRVEHRLQTSEPASESEPSGRTLPLPSESPKPQVDVNISTGIGGLYEGSSSFINQSVQASEVAQRTANSETPEAARTISESFSHLDALLRPSTAPSPLREHQFTATSRPTPTIEPLPVSSVIASLQIIKAQSGMLFSGHLIRDVSLIENLCQRIYFPTEPVSLGHVTSVNGILYMMFWEFKITKQSIGQGHELQELLAKSERNFNLGIETYDVVAVPTFENIICLTLGVMKARNEAKQLLYRTLMASAINHCQMLGYHRETTHQKDQSGYSETKRRLFWSLYVFDKNVTILLGQTSKIQDFDVDSQYPTLSKDPTQRAWDEGFHLTIRLAKSQGQIFDRLYSAAALRASPTERKQSIDSLKLDMRRWRNDLDQLDISQARYPEILNLSKNYWDIMYYSTLTSLLRAPAAPAMGAEMSSECFQAARLSLHGHLRCFSGFHKSGLSEVDFANWVLHNSSFTPFVVIFLHAIAASSLEDVQLLSDVVETLESAQKGHAGTKKLYQICATFARLARRMVEARNSCVGMYDHSTDSLQLAGATEDVPWNWSGPPLDMSDQTQAGGLADWGDNDMSAILADWINGQPPTMEMLSMDFGQ
ncbi:hypothetical protein FZEAL_4529 [Fusarium zealandicum]|uniref:Zn(2)-C6 fungal-type domain-containing protein n=1 Tax=Fusarium zealandicum TaxID=1053134 RepID=A0A8H4UM79_9HYPO|nr:hypothetical protein FZEAL_4529 [Fusarium zealandicum]